MPASMVQGRARPPAGGQIRRWSRLALLAGVLVLLQAAWAAGPRPGPAAGSMEGRAAPAGPVIGRPDRPGHGQGWASLGPHRVRYQIHRGRALAEGDIDLGDAAALRRREARGGVGSQGLAVPGAVRLWPAAGGVAQVPYEIVSGSAAVNDALARFNTVFAGLIQWVPRSGQADHVRFELDPNDFSGAGYSAVGRVGGAQVLGGSIDMSLGTLLHEMGHAVGLQHEHSRADRDAHVRLLPENIIGSLKANFDTLGATEQALGLYDLASVMHYPAFTFSKNGLPTLESLPAGIPIGELNDYSAGDIDTLRRLYGQTPSQITLTSNPPGLQVLVDGVAVSTPHTVNWVLDSVHTLAMPATPQSLGARQFVPGRWNSHQAHSQAVTVARGSGLPGAPVSRPAVTVYTAHFVELLRHEPQVWPPGSGSVLATPAPLPQPPLPGLYHVKRQAVQLQAVPQPGHRFYRLYTRYGPVSQNPKTTRDPDWVWAYFTPQATTTIDSDPPGRWVWVDGAFWEAPVNFAADFDAGWGAGSSHTLDVALTVQQPFAWSIRHPWQNWSNGGAQTQAITVPAGSSTVQARFGTEFNAWAWAAQPCAGSVTLSPASADGFYPAGTLLSASQAPAPGWQFTGWQGDLSGSASPTALTMNDEHIVIAGYNTSAKPIAISSLAPASRVAGQGDFTLKIKGQGFQAGTRAWINGIYRAPSSASATQLSVPVSAAEAATPGALEVFVDNLAPGAACSAWAVRTFWVRPSSAQALAAAAPARLDFGKRKLGQGSTPQTVTVSNAGNRTLALHDLQIVGPQAGDFQAVASTCGAGLAAGASCTVDLRFQPGATGSRQAALWILDSALDSPQIVPLSGTGKAP